MDTNMPGQKLLPEWSPVVITMLHTYGGIPFLRMHKTYGLELDLPTIPLQVLLALHNRTPRQPGNGGEKKSPQPIVWQRLNGTTTRSIELCIKNEVS